MGESIITWNIPNFITVVLMGVLGMAVFLFISKAVRNASGQVAA